ncbi:unnamed protein product [Soboliphyme baturini]|uniref:heparosan-N-sulfate-glucuronate 5-epimerase n=1 Tax=Soboliphyme baturini TaxID=241478 RepID=A0A183IBF7_9BILA|nr:unnamed protein product [Soboliphyme baturini]
MQVFLGKLLPRRRLCCLVLVLMLVLIVLVYCFSFYHAIECTDVNKLVTLRRNEEHTQVIVNKQEFLLKHIPCTVNGSVKQNAKGVESFQFLHSYAKLHRPDFKVYDPFGPYGVPLSIQWQPKPYFYPIQVAQFALEHYSKNKTDLAPIRLLLHEATGALDASSVAVKSVNSSYPEGLWHFKNLAKESVGLQFSLNTLSNNVELFVIRFSVMFMTPNSFFTVKLRNTSSQKDFFLHYVQMDETLLVKGPNRLYYGIGSKRTDAVWRRITLELVSLTFHGQGIVTTPSLQSSSHMDHFFDGADWLLDNQDKNGGWPAKVRRVIANGALVLEPGWYSAMAQGHAMSVLCRAYNVSGDEKYLKAALKATDLFLVDASKQGLVNYLFGRIPWYEEYPTVPGTFVLNGFLYSLVGLYDMSHCDWTGRSRKLFERGLRSLKDVLPLYDIGYGSSYDLRHVSLKLVPPNIARWDYHSVHIYLLFWLHVIDSSNLFNVTAERWIRYTLGERAKHN